ncbi:MAG: FixH family protein [Deltaproteobacteria bacterium]|jgi:hypothetical protein|nr:FixH family protein [Deltaproteobacteria bacterium]
MICSRIKAVLAIFCLLCGTVFAVQAVPAFSVQAAQRATEIILEQKTVEYTWILKTPNKPGVVQVSLILRDAGANPVLGLSVTGEVWMPKMPMPGYPLELEFDEEGEGQYLALVQYGHGGYWQLRAKFMDAKGQLFEQAFDIDMED